VLPVKHRIAQAFEIKPEEGRFLLAGELSFATAPQALQRTTHLFKRATGDQVFDLARVERADSAGVALLLEWQRRADQNGVKLCYVNLPEQLQAIMRVAGVDKMLAFSEEARFEPSSGQITES
jgi:phospholipid transport system transporter-binding protein